MAIAFDAATDGGLVNPGTSLTWSHTCTGANRLIRVGTRSNTVTDNVTGVTYAGVALTKVRGHTALDRCMALWELQDPASGANNVVVSGSSGVIMAEAASYTGARVNDVNNSGDGGGAQTSLTVSATPVADNCWMQGAFGNNIGNPSAGGGTTKRIGSANGIGLFDNNAAISPPASTSLTASTAPTSGLHVGIVASLVPAAAAGNPWYFYANQQAVR